VQPALFYEFSLEQRVPADHSIDRFVDGIRGHLWSFYRELGRPSIDPELLIRMLIIGYCMGVHVPEVLRDGDEGCASHDGQAGSGMTQRKAG
jgi:hypothetical protein